MSKTFAATRLRVVSATLAACGVFPGVPAVPASALETSMNQARPDSLRFVVEVPERVDAGEAVRVRLVVENVSAAGVTLYVTGRPVAFDVEVRDDADRLVWRRLEGEIVSMVLQIRELAAGERLVFETEWDQRTRAGQLVPPGAYRVRGLLPSDVPEPMVTPAAALRIGEG
jgi:hypothetical protein